MERLDQLGDLTGDADEEPHDPFHAVPGRPPVVLRCHLTEPFCLVPGKPVPPGMPASIRQLLGSEFSARLLSATCIE